MNSTYQVTCPNWPGLAKVVEESGELGQVFGKIVSCGGEVVYPWGGTDLRDKMNEETADLLAALLFMVIHSPHLNQEEIFERAQMKFERFVEWRNNSDG
jgi:hypothetical protein